MANRFPSEKDVAACRYVVRANYKGAHSARALRGNDANAARARLRTRNGEAARRIGNVEVILRALDVGNVGQVQGVDLVLVRQHDRPADGVSHRPDVQ